MKPSGRSGGARACADRGLPSPGDPRTRDPKGFRALFCEPRFTDAAFEELVLAVDVPEHDLWAFFEAAYYGIDLVSEHEARALRAWVERERASLAPDGTMRWPFGMRSFRVTRG